MNILTKYTLKYLWLNKKRTGVTIFGVILSSALICGVILLGVSFQKMMIDRAISDTGNYHAAFLNVPFEKAKYIQQNSAIDNAMIKTAWVSTTFGSQDPYRPYLYLSAYDEASLKNGAIHLTAGRMPQKDGELLISQEMAAGPEARLQLDSELKVTFGKRSGPNGETLDETSDLLEGETFTLTETRTYTIVGLMDPLYEELISAFPGYAAVALLNPAGLAPSALVDVAVLARNPRSIYTTLPEIVRSAGLGDLSPEGSQPGGFGISYNDNLLQWMGVKDNDAFMRFFVTILGIMITLVVAGSGLVIYNAFSISIGERKKQFGMFASTGATAGQIRQAVLFEGLVIGLTGIPLGILGGILGVGITLASTENVVRQLIQSEQGMQLVVSPLVIVLTVLFTAVTILLSAWIPARRAAKVSPIEAIRLSGEIQSGGAKNLKTSPLVRRLFGFEGELALKSMRRDRKKYRTTVISLMISIILFVAFNAMMQYTTTSAQMDNQAVNYDLSVYLGDYQAEKFRFLNQVVRLPQVQAYSHVRCLDGQIFAGREQLTGLAYQTLSEVNGLDFSTGKAPLQLNVCAFGQAEFEHFLQQAGPVAMAGSDTLQGILVNQNKIRQKKLYEFELFNLKPRENLLFSSYPTSDTDHPGSVSLTIGAITKELPLGAQPPSYGSLLVVSDTVFDKINGLLSVEEPDMGNLYFQSNDTETLTEQIKQLYRAAVGNNVSYYSLLEYNQHNQMTELMVKLFFYGFLTLITLVGVTNIINTIDTNIHLRRREFAMLKSVGLTPGGFARILRYESLFYGLTALAFGLPIGIALSALIYKQFGEVSSFGFSLPWMSILICIIGVLLIVFVTMMLSGARIRNDNIIDTIKEENL